MPHYTVPESVFAGWDRRGPDFRGKDSEKLKIEHLTLRLSTGLELTQAAFEIVQRAFEHLTKTRVLSGCELLTNSLAGKK